MLAQIAHISSVAGGVKVDDESLELRDFLIRPFPDET